MTTSRAKNEIEYGKFLASQGAENVWNWGSPAGKKRALKRADKVIAAAKLAPGITALELGCGTGLFTQLFAKTGAQIHANDISAELLEIAEKQNPGVKFIHSRFEDIPANKQYDAIIGSSVLHHLEIAPSLAKSYELLKPGGVLAFAEPNMLNPQVFAERTFLRNILSSVSPDETAFVRWQLAKQLRAFGFVDVRITPFDWLHPAIPQPLIGVTEAVGGILESLPLVREFSGSLLIRAVKPGN
ncbi:MAG: methyltransferase domain-containing protein [Anaerolineales bacterium]|nr:MAG: methyltransferase domain-containing protein [Anaerolineales bacterium]